MPAFNAGDFLSSLSEDEGAAGVDKAFAALAAKLPRAEYRAAVDAIENWLGSNFQSEIKKNGVAAVKNRMTEEAGEVPLSAIQMSSQVILNIGRMKGDKASPLVKAFVCASEKLTDEEHNTEEGALKPMMAAMDALAAAQATAKQSPHRQKIPGTRQ